MRLKRKTRLWWAIGLFVLLVIVVVYFYWWYNPAEIRFAPRCVFKWLTGCSCPGCGGQRALHAMLHGHFLEGLSYNPLWIVMIPYAALLSYLRLFGGDRRFRKLADALDGNVAILIFCIVLVVYTIVRNIWGF